MKLACVQDMGEKQISQDYLLKGSLQIPSSHFGVEKVCSEIETKHLYLASQQSALFFRGVFFVNPTLFTV